MERLIAQGEVWWTDLGEPRGSIAGFRRPVIVVQANALNASRLATVLCVPLTTKLAWQTAPTCLFLPAKATGLDRDSVAQAMLMVAVDRAALEACVGKLSEPIILRLFRCVDVALGR